MGEREGVEHTGMLHTVVLLEVGLQLEIHCLELTASLIYHAKMFRDEMLRSLHVAKRLTPDTKNSNVNE